MSDYDYITPNKKAWELIDKYFPLVEFDLDKDKQIQKAKECAKLTVNEILNTRPFDHEYWEDVLKELNVL